MTATHEYLGQKLKPGDFGIELECEFGNAGVLAEKLPEPWKIIEDHSLRGFGYEFVAKKPIYAYDLKGTLEDICKIINKKEYQVIESFRTSVHVHVNIQQFTPCELWTGITAYWLLENLLTNYCGPQRKGRMYCLAASDADNVITIAKEDLEKPNPFKRLDYDGIRYAGLNLTAIPRYGSLEFRSMRGVYDPVVIYNWATTVRNLLYIAKQYGTPEAFFDAYEKAPDKELFVSSLIHKDVLDELKKDRDWLQHVTRNEDIAAEIAYAVEDWNTWEKGLALPKPKAKREIAQDMLPADARAAREHIMFAVNVGGEEW